MGVVGHVDVYENGQFAGTYSITGPIVDLTSYSEVTKIKMSITDSYGLWWDNFVFTQYSPAIDGDANNDGTINEADKPFKMSSPGVLLALDSQDDGPFEPLVIQSLPGYSVESDDLKIAYDEAILQLYSDSGGNNLIHSGDPVTPGTTIFAQGIDVGSTVVSLYMGVSQSQPADEIQLTVRNVDLDIISPDGSTVQEDSEDDPGGFVLWNNDDDDDDGIIDRLDGHIDGGDDDLTELRLRDFVFAGSNQVPGVLTLDYDQARIRIWIDREKNAAVVPGVTEFDSSIEHVIYVEGWAVSSGMRDVAVRATYTVGIAGTDHTIAEDVVRLTVLTLDLDIDSDNNNGVGNPSGSDWEEELETNEYGLGKLIMLDTPTRGVTPIVLRLPANLNSNDPSIRVRLDWDPGGQAGIVVLWDTPVTDDLRNPAEVDLGGNAIAPQSAYSLADLGYDPTTGEIVVYAEALQENPLIKTLAGVEQHGKPDERIRATLVANGNDIGFDEVKYLVANEDSFFYYLQTRREVRSELASRDAYQPSDMPSLSLELLTYDELVQLGINTFTAGAIASEIGTFVPGFGAAMYRDYIGGEERYVLAFAGTDDAVWEGEWSDALEDIQQGIGLFAPQYRAALDIGAALVGVPQLNDLIVAGHSLGGGLASTAAIAGGFRADTFNAAGLSRSTLLEEVSGVNVEIYPGSLARYDNAAALINAYYVDWDILNWLQDLVHTLGAPIPTAIGTRIGLDGPFDLAIAGNSAIVSASLVAGSPWGVVVGFLSEVTFMVRCHFNDTVLYGLLVEENSFGQIVIDTLGFDEYF